MSPRRIEQETYMGDVPVTKIIESDSEFSVAPKYATVILGAVRGTLFRHDGSDVGLSEKSGRGGRQERVYDDNALLRIAIELGRVNILPHEETGLTTLSVDGCETLLNIDWDTTQEWLISSFANRA